jgi:hypothetical protein
MATLEQLQAAANILGTEDHELRRLIASARQRGQGHGLSLAEQYDEVLRWMKDEQRAKALEQAKRSIDPHY